MLWLLTGPPGFACWISFSRYSVLCTVESFFLLYLLFISWFICSRRWCMDKLGVFHANQTSMCFDPNLNKGWGWRRETGLSPPVKYFTDRSNAVLSCGSFVTYILRLSFFRVCSRLPSGHLQGKGWPPGSDVVLDLSIPDLCRRS